MRRRRGESAVSESGDTPTRTQREIAEIVRTPIERACIYEADMDQMVDAESLINAVTDALIASGLCALLQFGPGGSETADSSLRRVNSETLSVILPEGLSATRLREIARDIDDSEKTDPVDHDALYQAKVDLLAWAGFLEPRETQ